MIVWLVLIGLVIIGNIIYFLFFPVRKKNKRVKHADRLRKTGCVLKVRTSEIVIKSRETYITHENDSHSTIAMLDSLYGTRDAATKEKIDIAVLVYEGNVRGRQVRFVSDPIQGTNEEVAGILGTVQVINIYFDQENFNNYFFDISNLFLMIPSSI